MADETHTPGPWTVKLAHNRDAGIMADGGILAECFTEIRRENEQAYGECLANANLIAAAPEMLEALKAILDWAGSAAQEAYFLNKHILDADKLFKQRKETCFAAYAIIAKAEGKT